MQPSSHSGGIGQREAVSSLHVWQWGLWLLPFLVVYILYGRALTLPLYWDDARHYEYAYAPSFRQIWLNDTGYGYYRPAIFSFYKLAFTYLTPQLIFVCYGTALACHALNSVLAGQLAAAFLRQARPAGASLVSPRLAGVAASLLFAAYPFSLFSLANFASLMHPVVVLGALIGALAALRFVRAQKKRWLAVMALAAALAPWFHESGIAVAATLILELAVLNWRLAWQHRRGVGLLALAACLFVLAWLQVPKTRGETKLVDVKTMLESAVFYAQGLTYPLQPLATLAVNRLGWGENAAVRIIAGPSMLLLMYLLWRGRQWRAGVLGLAWWGLACAPAIAILPYWYLVSSPRLLYDVAPSAVLIWSLALASAADLIHSRRAGAIIFAGLSMAATVIPIFFITDRLTLFQVALDPLRQMAALARAHPSETHLVINPADWVATAQDAYPLGRWGVEIAPGYVKLSELVSMNAGLPARFDGVHFPPLRTSMEGHNWAVYHEDVMVDWTSLAAAVLQYDRVWVTTYAPDRITVEEAGGVRLSAAMRPSTYLASFEDKVFLVEAVYQVEGQAAEMTLEWKYLGPDPDATVFRHVLDCAGNALGVGDGHVLGRTLLFGFMTPGEEAREVRRISLDSPSPDGCYAAEVGLYRSDGSRVRAIAPDGSEFENGAVRLH